MSNLAYHQFFPQMVATSFLEITDEQHIFLRGYISASKIDQPHRQEDEHTGFASDNKYVLNDSELSFLKDIIMGKFNEFKNSIMRYDNTIFEMNTSWITKTPKGHYSNFHNHNNCMFSGVFYFDESSDLEFEDFSTRRFDVTPSEYNNFNSVSQAIQIKKNMVVFFDSRLWHKISLNESDETRYSLAFNIVPTGLIGYGDSQASFKLDTYKS